MRDGLALKTTNGEVARLNDRSIGAMLVDSGVITLEQADEALALQRQERIRFGEAAVKLGLVTQADIQRVLSRQYDFPILSAVDSPVSPEVFAAFTESGPEMEALRAIRSQLMLRWFHADEDHRALAVVSPRRRDGRTTFVANLGVVFSQLGERTLLIDADLRAPRLHTLFGLDNSKGLSTLLNERTDFSVIQRVPLLNDLSVLTAGAQPPNPQELVSRPSFLRLLDHAAAEFDVILIDTPALETAADSQTLAARAEACALVVRRHHSRVREVRDVAERMRSSNCQVVGTVITTH